jgi:hypothetical protein
VIGIESIYSARQDVDVGLFLENAQELEELRRLLPRGSILVGETSPPQAS